jgi:hypothetical protein
VESLGGDIIPPWAEYMIFFIIITLLFIYLSKISKPCYTNGVTLIFANIGTGKTTLLSKIATEELKKIQKGKSKYKYIVSNAQIKGVTYISDIRKLLKAGAFAETLILIDEGSIEYNNRKMNLADAEIQYLKLIRHYHSGITILSQSYDDIDVTLRRLYTKLYILRKLPLFTLIQPIKKKVGIDEQTKQIIDQYRFEWFFSWRLFFRPKYYKFFNSWWVPENVEVHDLSKQPILPKYEKKGIMSIIGQIKSKTNPRNLFRGEEGENESGV